MSSKTHIDSKIARILLYAGFGCSVLVILGLIGIMFYAIGMSSILKFLFIFLIPGTLLGWFIIEYVIFKESLEWTFMAVSELGDVNELWWYVKFTLVLFYLVYFGDLGYDRWGVSVFKEDYEKYI